MHGKVNGTATAPLCSGVIPLRPGSQKLHATTTQPDIQPNGGTIFDRLEIRIVLPVEAQEVKRSRNRHTL